MRGDANHDLVIIRNYPTLLSNGNHNAPAVPLRGDFARCLVGECPGLSGARRSPPPTGLSLISLLNREFTGKSIFLGLIQLYRGLQTRRILPFPEPNSLRAEQGVSAIRSGNRLRTNSEFLCREQRRRRRSVDWRTAIANNPRPGHRRWTDLCQRRASDGRCQLQNCD